MKNFALLGLVVAVALVFVGCQPEKPAPKKGPTGGADSKATTGTTETKKDIDEAKKDIDEAKKDIDEAKKDIGEVKKDAAEVKKDAEEVKKDAAEVKAPEVKLDPK